ncbi:hypothetical protein HELRODRAFT_175178 [Helobdella robusta]|uniref:EGF-like calcium-binding domain-containing protein n=1 Tax=Helobdella robusta TaxID=6412 RepID=T1F8Y9_HELRO|nr:hypothetical protein HELRODRAFT_175178 [Helobdella robusta]ESO01148.1 hypothetical protein HELRODRAFT_175178 [Helobdella robusta]
MDPNLCGGPDDVCINTLGGYKCQTVKCPKSFILVKSRIFNTEFAICFYSFEFLFSSHDIFILLRFFGNKNFCMSVFCRKMQQTCPFNEHDCLIIQSFSINFIVLDTSKIITPMTLHVVKMKMTRGSEMRYSLEVVSAIDPATGYDAGIDERIFYANKLILYDLFVT